MNYALLTLGTFDTPHMGHASFLRRCERHADRVIVGLNSDRFVKEYRGGPPVYTYDERLRLIRALGYDVLANDGPGADLIRVVRPDVLAIGSDWATRDYYAQIGMTHAELDAMGIGLFYLPYTHGISSTELKTRLA